MSRARRLAGLEPGEAVDKLEAQTRLDQAKVLAGAPPWLAIDDPVAMQAWRKARGEIAEVVTRQ